MIKKCKLCNKKLNKGHYGENPANAKKAHQACEKLIKLLGPGWVGEVWVGPDCGPDSFIARYGQRRGYVFGELVVWPAASRYRAHLRDASGGFSANTPQEAIRKALENERLDVAYRVRRLVELKKVI